MTLKVLVADDDQAIGLFLKSIIEEITDVQVVGIAKDGKEAVRLVEFHKPHVIFLDIDMPALNGIEVAEQLRDIQSDIKLVFATAHPDYALEAFKLYSYDYILKPFDIKRIQKTVRKLKDSIMLTSVENIGVNNQILIQVDDRKVFINSFEILFIEGQGHRVLIKTEKGNYLTRLNLGNLEHNLNPKKFFRCHKGYIVNLEKVKEIVPSNRTFEVILVSGDRVLLSREREKALRELILIK